MNWVGFGAKNIFGLAWMTPLPLPHRRHAVHSLQTVLSQPALGKDDIKVRLILSRIFSIFVDGSSCNSLFFFLILALLLSIFFTIASLRQDGMPRIRYRKKRRVNETPKEKITWTAVHMNWKIRPIRLASGHTKSIIINKIKSLPEISLASSVS